MIKKIISLTILITILITFGCTQQGIPVPGNDINDIKDDELMNGEDVSIEYNEEEEKLYYSINLNAPRACDSFEVVETNILESYPTQLVIKLKPLETDMVCATVITPITIDGTIELGHNPGKITIMLEDEVIFQSKENTELEKNYCTEEQKQAEICTMEYNPVCGGNGKTYSNPCTACASNEIEYYVEGEC